jgi:hypothetical protein
LTNELNPLLKITPFSSLFSFMSGWSSMRVADVYRKYENSENPKAPHMFFSGGVGSVFTKFWKKHPTKKIACLFLSSEKIGLSVKRGKMNLSKTRRSLQEDRVRRHESLIPSESAGGSVTGIG